MLSQRVKNLKGSPTLALAAKAKELKSAGKDVISLSVGEPDWDTFDVIKNAGIAAIQNGVTKYTPASGTPELRKAIADQTSQDLGLSYNSTNVTVSTGGKFIIFSALQSLVDPGDEVIIPAPYWVSYPEMVELAGGKPVIIEGSKQCQFKASGEMLKNAITNKTKVLILNSPSNPTGEMYTEQELKELAEVLKQHPQVVVLSDDIYNRLVFSENGLAPHILQVAPEFKDRTLVVNGISKTYSMTGWRVGWALGPEELIGGMNRYQSQSASCASSISQEAALAAVLNGAADLKKALVELKSRRDFIYQGFKKIPGIEVTEPQGAFYIWPDVSSYFGKSFQGQKITNSDEFAQALLQSETVVAVPGASFGMEGYLRVSYALKTERMQQALDRIDRFVKAIE